MAFHEFSVEAQDTEQGFRAIVKLDGKKLDCCTGYSISHNAGEFPSVEISVMPVIPKVKYPRADVRISNLHQLAEIMDEADFKMFCGIWNKLHG